MINGTAKHTNFSVEEIKNYIYCLKDLIKNDRYQVAINKNRLENKEFIYNYRLTSQKIKSLLLNLEYIDFCYAVDNYKKDFFHEKLYVFCKELELDNWGELELVKIYIKTNLTQSKSGDDYVIVISFHKLNEPIRFLFK